MRTGLSRRSTGKDWDDHDRRGDPPRRRAGSGLLRVLPYHAFGTVKTARIGKHQKSYTPPDGKTLANARKYMADRIAELSRPD